MTSTAPATKPASGMDFALKRNSIWAISELIISSLSLFLIYKILIVNVGIAGVGLWSLILATTSFGRFADVGAAAGLSQKVAQSLAQNDRLRARVYMDTAFILNLTIFSGFSCVIFLIVYSLFAKWIPPSLITEAKDLLPYAFVSFILANLAATVVSALIGQHRTDLKCILVVSGLSVQLCFALILIPRFGLKGLVISQIVQNLCIIVAGRYVGLRRLSNEGSLTGVHYTNDAAKDLVRFGGKLQILSIAGILMESLMKIAFSSTCGVSALGLFELAYRIVFQARNIASAPSQALAPVFAHLTHGDVSSVSHLHQKALAVVLLFGGPFFLALSLSLPIVSYIWLGYFDVTFTLMGVLCCVGWFLNLIVSPTHLLAISRDVFRWNLLCSVGMSVAIPALGSMAGIVAGPVAFTAVAMAVLGLVSLLNAVLNARSLHVATFPSRALLKSEAETLWRTIRRSIARSP